MRVDGAGVSAVRRVPGGTRRARLPDRAGRGTITLEHEGVPARGFVVDLRGQPISSFEGTLELRPFEIATPSRSPAEGPPVTSGAPPSLVPELDVADLDVSRTFYVDLLGFRVVYERPAERFVYIARDRAAIMLEEAAGPRRRFRAAPLARPFGRGVNFQLEVPDVDAVYEKRRRGGMNR